MVPPLAMMDNEVTALLRSLQAQTPLNGFAADLLLTTQRICLYNISTRQGILVYNDFVVEASP
jgi:hypothetical protein